MKKKLDPIVLAVIIIIAAILAAWTVSIIYELTPLSATEPAPTLGPQQPAPPHEIPTETTLPESTQTPIPTSSPWLAPEKWDAFQRMRGFDFIVDSQTSLVGTDESGSFAIFLLGSREQFIQAQMLTNVTAIGNDVGANYVATFILIGAGEDGFDALQWYTDQLGRATIATAGNERYFVDSHFSNVVVVFMYSDSGDGEIKIIISPYYP
jgi:hypothetical protein